MRAFPSYARLAFGLWCLAAGPVFGQSPAVRTHLDAAAAYYEQEALDAADEELDAALRLQKKTPLVYYWKGMIALKRGKSRQAEKAFRKAGRMDRKMAGAYYGLALTYRTMKHRRHEAIEALEHALKLDPDYVDARYALALIYLDMSVKKGLLSGLFQVGYVKIARDALERTIELAPKHPEAYYRLGVLYEDGIGNLEKAIPYYARQVEINPDHPEAVHRLGLAYFETKRYGEGVRTLSRLLRKYPALSGRVGPALAMLRASLAIRNRQYAHALSLQDEYLASLPEKERAVYEDISWVASDKERKAYRRLSPLDQAEYRRRFWKQRDPDPTTPANERLIEHYRRVMYARAYFGKSKFPWDRRGEIYLRYGDPDDRQQFTFAVGEKQRTNQGSRLLPHAGGLNGIANQIRDSVLSKREERSHFAPTGNARVDAIRELNLQQRYQLGVEASTIGVSAYRAESWVYVPMGVELFFIDQLSNGVFDFPLMTESRDVQQAARQAEYHPARLAREMVRKRPEAYYHDYGGAPMQFFFDVAAFRGEGNDTDVEVAFGVPVNQLGSVSDGHGGQTSLEGRAALMDAEWRDAARADARMGPFPRPATTGNDDDATEMTTFQLPVSTRAGEYTLGVAVRDGATRKIGIYRRKITVPSYTSPYFMLSDIKLASSVRPVKRKRGPFLRNGLEIVPNPTHTYAVNQPLHVYYELYNLRQDEQGDTRFETRVTVTARERARRLVWRILSGFGRLVKGPKLDHALTFTIYDGSKSPMESRYTEIDLNDSPPGPYTVEISVTDVLAHRTATKRADFVLTDAVAAPAPAVAHRETSARDEAPAPDGPPASGPAPPTVESADGPDVADSTLLDPSVPVPSNPPWNALLRILQTPGYMLAAGDSAQSAVQDTTITAFVSKLPVHEDTVPSVVGPQGDAAYHDMIYIPGGMFLMGSDDGNTDERPMQSVFVKPFYIDRCEVRNEEYKQFLDATGHAPPRQWKEGRFPPGEERYPVVGVSWYDARAYAKWKGKRLPTEMEWEKAARGEDGRVYPWGDEFIPSWLNVGGEHDLYKASAPVGSFPEGVSPYGVSDMAGNVWEWTADWLKPYKGNDRPDPSYGERYRVIRGGSWINYDGNTRTSNRGKYYPADTSLLLGFRCVKETKADLGVLATSGYGYLMVATPGAWADIFVDGEKLGQTPRADPLRLHPGRHTLLLVNPYYQEYKRTVDIEKDAVKKERAVLVRK